MSDRLGIGASPKGPEFNKQSKITVKKGSFFSKSITVECRNTAGKIEKIKLNKNSLINCINSQLGPKDIKLKKSSCFRKGSPNSTINQVFQKQFTLPKKLSNNKPPISQSRIVKNSSKPTSTQPALHQSKPVAPLQSKPVAAQQSKPVAPYQSKPVVTHPPKLVVTSPPVTQLLQKQGKNVGVLGAQWQFNSDHIPLGGVVTIGNTQIKIATFNVLNKAFLHHIKGGGQGLAQSQIMINDQLGLREKQLKDTVIALLTSPSSRDFLALQECSKDFEESLNKALPQNFRLISSGFGNDRQVYIYNEKTLILNENETEIIQLGTDHNKKMSRMVFTEKNGAHVSFVGVHLPGGANSPQSRQQLGDYLMTKHDLNVTTIVLGDMNATTQDVGNSIASSFGNNNPFNYLIKGSPTHINTKKDSVDYDSIHIFAPNGVKYYENKPETLLPGLGNIAKLLVM